MKLPVTFSPSAAALCTIYWLSAMEATAVDQNPFPPRSGNLTAPTNSAAGGSASTGDTAALHPLPIQVVDPPEKDFFSKQLDFEGIPIKAHQVVSDEAMRAGFERLQTMFARFGPYREKILKNLTQAGVELHIIGRNQVTTDLPEWRQDKGKPLPEYKGLTRDERTRGMGGKLVSCGEENLLRLEKDRYRGRDICVHEFGHVIRNIGITPALRARFDAQFKRSTEAGRWFGAYAGSNANEFFAELGMWYFGTHGDLGMKGPRPENGPDGLKAYDPEAYALFDEFYSGRANY